jgi:hypothetical protein
MVAVTHIFAFWGFWSSKFGSELVNFLGGPVQTAEGAGVFVAVITGLYHIIKSRNCHQKRCPRIQFGPHPDHGHPVCKKHYQDPAENFDHGLSTKNHRKPPVDHLDPVVFKRLPN